MKSMHASFLPGPVVLTRAVRAAFRGPPVSHREPAFLEMMSRTRAALSSLVQASHVALMVGTGTLANEAVAAQLRCIEGPGLILANGEFGERLAPIPPLDSKAQIPTLRLIDQPLAEFAVG